MLLLHHHPGKTRFNALAHELKQAGNVTGIDPSIGDYLNSISNQKTSDRTHGSRIPPAIRRKAVAPEKVTTLWF